MFPLGQTGRPLAPGRDRRPAPPRDSTGVALRLRRRCAGSGTRDGAGAGLARIFVKAIRSELGADAANPEWIFIEHDVSYRMAEPGAERTLPRRRLRPVRDRARD